MDKKESAAYFRHMDTLWQAGLAHLTMGISPAGASGALFSWVSHLAQAPGKIARVVKYSETG